MVCHKNSASLAKPGQKVVHPKCMALFVPYGLQNSKHFMITMGLERDFMPNHSLLSAAFFCMHTSFVCCIHINTNIYIWAYVCESWTNVRFMFMSHPWFFPGADSCGSVFNSCVKVQFCQVHLLSVTVIWIVCVYRAALYVVKWPRMVSGGNKRYILFCY